MELTDNESYWKFYFKRSTFYSVDITFRVYLKILKLKALKFCMIFLLKVVLLTGRRLLHLHNLTGSQVGAYFGHAVAVLDANGDGHDDIAIGAPLHRY